MKTNEYVTDLNTKSVDELAQALVEAKKELFNLRFQHVTGQLENPVKLRETKRDIARIKTIIREKELEKVNS